ncbi:universal stress protein [Orrella sp. 11846]|uniref:universal stress protein n=1 Tax=Orrella sp. 11846 TaxID=3409913 RepID=UPI003B5B2049
MKDLNTILVATDLSEPSMAAISRGLALAQLNGSECTVLHVVPRDLVFSLQGLIGPSSKNVENESIQRQTQALNQTVNRLMVGRELNVVTRIRLGQPSIEIAEQAEEDEAELIVVSSEGLGAIRRMLIGSTTMAVLHESPAPVLVVKTQEARDYEKAMLLVDFSKTTPSVIRAARRYAPDAHYVLVNVLETALEDMSRLALIRKEQIETLRNTAYDQATEELTNLAKKAGLTEDQFSVELLEGDITTCIPKAQERLQCDLMITGKQGHHATRDRLLGSFTQSILNLAKVDVLVSQPRAHEDDSYF